ncbi:MAG: SDR family oxidoreductase [Chloroflexi bacterium]|nr:SDR family oxidoreductase [Chloroflexota bacterium]
MRLHNKTAIVTGGGRGIGEAICYRFAREGANVVVASRSIGEHVAQKIRDEGGKAVFLQTDVARPDSVERMVQTTVENFGGVDILVNNAVLASFPYAANVWELELDAMHELFSVDLDGALLCAQAAARQMIAQKRGGRIVNISSIMAFLNAPRLSAYHVAKRALNGLTESLALELIPYGIVVNCVAPGWIDTRWNVETVKTQEWQDKHIKGGRLPIARQASPDEVAGVVLFFSSDDSSYVIGQTLIVDGGLSLTS